MESKNCTAIFSLAKELRGIRMPTFSPGEHGCLFTLAKNFGTFLMARLMEKALPDSAIAALH